MKQFECIAGPFGSHYNYLIHIAFPNCRDYLKLVEEQSNKKRIVTPDISERLRFYMNAAVSFNSVPEYIYYEFREEFELGTIGNFRGLLRHKHLVCKEIAECANAYKYCETDKNKKNARDFHKSEISVGIGFNTDNDSQLATPVVDVEFKLESLDDDELIARAFQFWMKYHNEHRDDIEFLIGKKVSRRIT